MCCAQEQESLRNGTLTQRLIERSVFSDRMVFVRAVHNAKWMSELELNVYDSWFNPIVSALPTVSSSIRALLFAGLLSAGAEPVTTPG